MLPVYAQLTDNESRNGRDTRGKTCGKLGEKGNFTAFEPRDKCNIKGFKENYRKN